MKNMRPLLYTTAIAALSMPSIAFAAEQGKAATVESSDAAPGEIIVTARRRNESLQTTPVAVTVLNEEALRSRGVVDVRDVAQSSPSTFVTTTTSSRNSPSIGIRGQIQTDSLITLDPAVGTYVDDVYVARPMGILGEMLDISSVEVLKGPQGTLYGRNTTGGAFKLVTTKPDASKTSGYARFGYGNYNALNFQGAVNLPLIADVLAVRYAISHAQHDGYTHSYILARGTSVGNGVAANPLATDTPGLVLDTDNRNTTAQRLSVRLTPDENLTIDVSGEIVRSADNGSAFYNQRGDIATTTSGGYVASAEHLADFYSLRTDVYSLGYLLTKSARASIEYKLAEDLTAKVTYGHRWVTSTTSLNNDGNVFAAAVANAGANFPSALGVSANGTYFKQQGKQDSIEAQLSGKAFDGKANWILGGFWFKETGYDYQNQALSAVTITPPVIDPAAPGSIPRRGDGTNKSWSAFANIDFDVTDQLSVTGGLRYTKDNKVLVVTNRTGTPVPALGLAVGGCLFTTPTTTIPGVVVDATNCLVTAASASSFVSFLGNISYKISPDAFAYFKVSNGYRSGGGQARAVNNQSAAPFTPEKVLDFEAGLKLKLFDNMATLNLAAFHTERKNIQLSEVGQFTVGTSVLRTTFVANSGTGTYNGVEAELNARLGGGFSIQGSASYFEEKRSDFVDPLQCNTIVTTCAAVAIVGQKTFVGSASLIYENDFSFGRLNARVDVNKVPKYYPDQRVTVVNGGAAPQFAVFQGYALVNARLGVTLSNDVSISVYGKNILAKKYFRAGLVSGGNYPASFGDPQTYGFEIGYKF